MNIVDSLKNYAGSVAAATRYIGTFAGGAAVAVGILGFNAISTDQVSQLFDAFQKLGTALSSALTALGTIVGIASAVYAAWKSTRAQQTKTVASIPGVQVHVDTAPKSAAPPQVQALVASQDPAVHDVVPMNGPPVVKP